VKILAQGIEGYIDNCRIKNGHNLAADDYQAEDDHGPVERRRGRAARLDLRIVGRHGKAPFAGKARKIAPFEATLSGIPTTAPSE
jgi:hypothetical protein